MCEAIGRSGKGFALARGEEGRAVRREVRMGVMWVCAVGGHITNLLQNAKKKRCLPLLFYFFLAKILRGLYKSEVATAETAALQSPFIALVGAMR